MNRREVPMIVYVAPLLALTTVLASLGSLWPSDIPKPPAGAQPHRPSEQEIVGQGGSRIRKYLMRFARAADISYWLGGSVLVPSTDHLPGAPPPRAPWPGSWSGQARNFLPDGIDNITAYEADNTLLVVYSSDDG